MARVTVSIDDRRVRRNLRALGDQVIGRAMAKALNRTAFELREDEQAEARGKFTLRRLRPNFRFRGATAQRLEVEFTPLALSEEFLAQHVEGGRVTPGEGPERLTVGRRPEFAVPLRATLGRSGRIRRRDTPASLLAEGGKGFVAKDVVFARRGRGKSSRIVPMFALKPAIQLDPRFDFYGVAEKTARREFPRKAVEEFRKVRFGR